MPKQPLRTNQIVSELKAASTPVVYGTSSNAIDALQLALDSPNPISAWVCQTNEGEKSLSVIDLGSNRYLGLDIDPKLGYINCYLASGAIIGKGDKGNQIKGPLFHFLSREDVNDTATQLITAEGGNVTISPNPTVTADSSVIKSIDLDGETYAFNSYEFVAPFTAVQIETLEQYIESDVVMQPSVIEVELTEAQQALLQKAEAVWVGDYRLTRSKIVRYGTQDFGRFTCFAVPDTQATRGLISCDYATGNLRVQYITLGSVYYRLSIEAIDTSSAPSTIAPEMFVFVARAIDMENALAEMGTNMEAVLEGWNDIRGTSTAYQLIAAAIQGAMTTGNISYFGSLDGIGMIDYLDSIGGVYAHGVCLMNTTTFASQLANSTIACGGIVK